jgi:SAM-dependent methyltransferase
VDLSALVEHSLRGPPAPEAPGTDCIWTDPYISHNLLAAQLDPSTDAASRRPAAIEATLEWVLGLPAELGRPLRPSVSARILDLGCGPGLYAERLAARGCAVSGIDINEAAIDYARKSAAARGLAIDYRAGSYLELGYPAGLDAAIMIYCDFGALEDAGRRRVLSRLREALVPGGIFVFDVFGPGAAASFTGGRRWSAHKGGFWAAGPHLLLEEDYLYPEARSITRQAIVVDERGGARLFRNHDTWFDEASLSALLSQEGFEVEALRRDLLPPSDFTSDDVIFVAATRP